MIRIIVLATTAVVVFASSALQAQDMPPGAYVETRACSLHEGTTLAEAIQWGRNLPVDETRPQAIFFRQAIFNPGFRENYDFVIARYFPSLEEMVSRTEAAAARPATRVRSGVRAVDLFSCDPATQTVALNRTVNPDADVFEGQSTLMTTRFCRLNEGMTTRDAFSFAQAVAARFESAGDESLMQMYTRSLGPVGNTVAGTGVLLATVGATSESLAARLDLPNNGLNVLEGLSLPFACDFPALWRTHRIYQQED